MTNMEKLGFKGNLAWVHSEEGSGAKYYNSSAYYPDSRQRPKSQSGITIDPGLDLGNCEAAVAREVIEYYRGLNLVSDTQAQLLNKSIGLTRYNAIEWIRLNEQFFKGKMLIPSDVSLYIMDKFTAPLYWMPLVDAMPGLLTIKPLVVASAVHTALLSYSYNRGYNRAVREAKDFIADKNFTGLADAIAGTTHAMKSLEDRRKKEAALIDKAIAEKAPVVVDLNINPMPLQAIPSELKTEVMMAKNIDLSFENKI
ncbi:MAG: hypothetical protein HF314_12010 [Ignavibacteria bacterium]|jgi:hypothetical protein|nr:hypothetical protein [Ignavibacteria bacterium]MCU7503795.1 hypothetical protein [Ignavibacteria bacterium]MCU7517191.1 hypothetical protein [Ignavibacteria bacterium]